MISVLLMITANNVICEIFSVTVHALSAYLITLSVQNIDNQIDILHCKI